MFVNAEMMNTFQAQLTYKLSKYRFLVTRKDGYYVSFIPKKRALWYLVPKVASRSIKSRLEREFPDSFIYGGREVRLSDGALENWFRFGFTRHPVQRLESLWKQKVHRVNDMGVTEAVREQLKDFDNFIDWVADHDLSRCDPHYRKQVDLLDIPRMDFIGKMENFNADWAQVAEQLGMDPMQELERKNASKISSLHITKAQANRVAQLYAEDIAAFYPNAPF